MLIPSFLAQIPSPSPSPLALPATAPGLPGWIAVCIIIVSGLVAYGMYLVSAAFRPAPTREAQRASFRDRVAGYVLNGSIWGLIILASFIVLVPAMSGDRVAGSDSLQVFNSLLPVFGTWVGTLLAYYFAKENFEAASKTVRDMAGAVSGVEALQSIAVESVMLGGPEHPFVTLGRADLGKKDEEIPLKAITELLDRKKIDRLPLFAGNAASGPIRGVIHLSTIEKLVRKKAEDSPPVNFDKLHLSDLIAEPVLGALFGKSFAIVKTGSTLADAKARMDQRSAELGDAGNCYDIFVTADGQATSPVRGWITNDIINRHARV